MEGTRFIVAGSVIDGSGGKVRKNVLIVVKNGIIDAIDSAAMLSRDDGAVIDDFSHCTLLPALFDCSVSLSRSPSVDSRVRRLSEDGGRGATLAMLSKHIGFCYTHGVLGVAENDDITDLLQACRAGKDQGGEIDISIPDHLSWPRINRAPDVPRESDFIKIQYSANIDDEDEPDPRLEYEDLCRILQHRGKKKVVVVANGSLQVAEALEAGCDAIEQGYAMGLHNMKKMAEKGVLWIPALLRARNALDGAGTGGDICCRFSQRYAAPGKAAPGAETFWKKMLADQLSQLRFASKTGVTTAVGSGAGSIGILHGESMVEEMKLFVKAGCSLPETIRSASENGARFFGRHDLGQLTVGGKATFLIARGSVGQLPRKLSYLEGIYVDGRPSRFYQKNPVKTVS